MILKKEEVTSSEDGARDYKFNYYDEKHETGTLLKTVKEVL